MAFVVAQEVPTSSTMAVPHGPAGVGAARRRMRKELYAHGAPDTIVEDAVLILSELLSNSCRYARPLGTDPALPADGRNPDPQDYVRAEWSWKPNGELTVSVTDGGGPTRPFPATPSVTARGGRGLSIVMTLSQEWGVTEGDTFEGVTVWAVLPPARGCADGENRGIPGRAALDLMDLDEFL